MTRICARPLRSIPYLGKTDDRLRQVDVKSEHFERRVAGLEQERDALEGKFEEMQEKYLSAKRELEELHKQLEDL